MFLIIATKIVELSFDIHIEGVALMLIVAFALLELWIEQGYVASLVLTNIEKRGGF